MGKPRVRQCLATREELPEGRLIRFVISPSGEVTPDLAAKLPGRGAWVEARRDALERVVRKGLFAKSAQRSVSTPSDLVNRVEAQLFDRCLSLIGLAKRAGELVSGFDKVRALVKKEHPAYLVEASDGASDGRDKILKVAAIWGDVPIAGCFSAEQIGAALGTGATVHAALRDGSAARRFGEEMARLEGFRSLICWDQGTGDG